MRVGSTQWSMMGNGAPRGSQGISHAKSKTRFPSDNNRCLTSKTQRSLNAGLPRIASSLCAAIAKGHIGAVCRNIQYVSFGYLGAWARADAKLQQCAGGARALDRCGRRARGGAECPWKQAWG